MGHAKVRVVRKPNIAVIGVGDELTPPGNLSGEFDIRVQHLRDIVTSGEDGRQVGETRSDW